MQLDGASTRHQALSGWLTQQHRQDQMVLHYETVITALNLKHSNKKTPGQSFLLSRDGYAQRDMAPAGLRVELSKEETFGAHGVSQHAF